MNTHMRQQQPPVRQRDDDDDDHHGRRAMNVQDEGDEEEEEDYDDDDDEMDDDQLPPSGKHRANKRDAAQVQREYERRMRGLQSQVQQQQQAQSQSPSFLEDAQLAVLVVILVVVVSFVPVEAVCGKYTSLSRVLEAVPYSNILIRAVGCGLLFFIIKQTLLERGTSSPEPHPQMY